MAKMMYMGRIEPLGPDTCSIDDGYRLLRPTSYAELQLFRSIPSLAILLRSVLG
jgi:hypothetical protein